MERDVKGPSVELYSMVYNEELVLPYMFKHYRDRIPSVQFTIYDNHSTDSSVEIARKWGASVHTIDTDNKMSNQALNDFRSSIWKGSRADWVIVCDADEFVDINSSMLNYEKSKGTTLIRGLGYDMVGDTLDLDKLTKGVRSILYDKTLVFRPSEIREMNYGMGGHQCFPEGNIKWSKGRPNLYHMRYPSIQYVVDRYKVYVDKKSDDEKAKGWGHQYYQQEEEIRKDFDKMLSKAVRVR